MNNLQKEELSILLEFHRICEKHNLVYSLSSGTLLGAIRHKGFIPWDDDVDVVMLRDDYEKFCDVSKHELKDPFFLQTYETEKYHFAPFAKIRSSKITVVEKSTSHVKINHGAWIDVFPADNVPSDLMKQKQQYNTGKKYTQNIERFLYTYGSKNDSFIKRQIKNIIRVLNICTYRINPYLPYAYNKREKVIKQYNDSQTSLVGLLTFSSDFENHLRNTIRKSDFDDIILTEFEGKEFCCCKNYHDQLSKLYGDYMIVPDEKDRVTHNIEIKDM